MSVNEENVKKEEKVVEVEATVETVEETNRKEQIKTLVKKGLKIAGVVGVGILGYFVGKSRGSSIDTPVSDVIETEIIDK